MENKNYYQPNISEFHVGFEYEWFNGTQWVKCIIEKSDYINEDITDSFFQTFIIEENNDKCIRVKYLDKEDIEDLDWKNIIKYFELKYKDITYNLIQYKRILPNNTKQEGYRLFIKDENGFTEILFQGIIKNKSELKKIMEQCINSNIE